jgi:hypothetical protein
MNVDEAQRKAVSAWIGEGLKLSEIQNRLASEFGLRLTYMEVRLLVDDLKLTPKDHEPPKRADTVLAGSGPATQPPPRQSAAPTPAPGQPLGSQGRVSVSVDQLARPGALVSGKVTFSDGISAAWQLDQTGRVGLVPQQAGYRPPDSDLEQFKAALDTELSKAGF